MTEKPRIRVKAVSRPYTDSLTNVVANLGTSRDKSFSSDYSTPTLSLNTIINAYRGSWLPRKIVDIPAFDSCRAWRSWEAQPEQVTLLEKEEKRLGVKGKVLTARIEARLLGGCALLIGTGDADPSLPLDPATVKAGGIKYLTVVHKRQLSAQPVETDPASEYFDRPAKWLLNATGTTPAMVHASRLVILQGTHLVDPFMMGAQFGWGDPVLMAVFDAIRNADSAAANIASLLFEAKVDTVGIPDLMLKLSDPGYTDTLTKRWMLAETGKGINGTLLHDAEEILGQKQATFSGLSPVMDAFMILVSGAADIPMTRLMGQSPAGMSATGESDIRNYYDRISAAQELEMSPAMCVLDECLIRSALGSRPPEIDVAWNTLWQSTEKEKYEIGRGQAMIITALSQANIIPTEPLSEAAIAMLTHTGIMPGLQAAVQGYYAANPGAAWELGATGVAPTPAEIGAPMTTKDPVIASGSNLPSEGE